MRFSVIEQLAGSGERSEKVLYVAGGKNGEHFQAIAGAPSFQIGDDVMVFEGGIDHWLFGSSFGKHGVFRFIIGESGPIVIDDNGFVVTSIDNGRISVKEDYRCELSTDRKHCDNWVSSNGAETTTDEEIEKMSVNVIDFENDIRDIARNNVPATSQPLSGSEFVEFLEDFVAN